MHKHKDGDKFTPPAKKLRSTSGLHSHGDDYTLAPNEVGHTHLNKESKDRTGGPVDPSTKIKKKEKAVAEPAESAKKVTKKKVTKAKK